MSNVPKMKPLKYFEDLATEYVKSFWDYRLIPYRQLVLDLMIAYRKKNGIAWNDYKPVYDKYFNKYHG